MLDSANNKCYITTRTKEGEQKEMIKIPPTGVSDDNNTSE